MVDYENTYPWSLFEDTANFPTLRLESRGLEAPIYIDRPSGHRGEKYQTLASALVELMEKRTGGHPGRHDPVGFLLIQQEPDQNSKTITGGNVYATQGWHGEEDDPNREPFLSLAVHFNSAGPGRWSGAAYVRGVEQKKPNQATYKFDWDTDRIDEDEFEILIYRLYRREPEWTKVQHVMKTNAPDGGRDVTAEHVSNGNKVMVQCRHYPNGSLSNKDLQDILADANMHNYDEVHVATSGHFTEKACRWVEKREEDEDTPVFILEPADHLAARLVNYPELIDGSGLRP
jgi:hypothetical protein